VTEEILFGDPSGGEVGPGALPPDHLAALAELSDRGIPFVLIGAVAVALTGARRLTRDVDAMTREAAPAVEALYARGFRVVSRPVASEPGAYAVFLEARTAVESIVRARAASFKTIHERSRVEFDVWIGSPDEGRLPAAEIERRAVPAEIGGLTVRRACAEDLLELKRIALEADPERADRDLSDIRHLERYLHENGPEAR